MPRENTAFRELLSSVFSNIADSILEMSSDEIDAEIARTGDNSQAIKQILFNAVTLDRQKSLREARRRYDENFREYDKKNYDIPSSPKEKRRLLYSLIEGISMQSQLTLQNRDFSDVPDEDLDGYLRQLLEVKDAEAGNQQE